MFKNQESQKWLAIIASAMLYPLPFIFPQKLFWISFLYLVPLFYIGVLQKISWKEGYVWGLIALGGHEAGIFYGIFNLATGGAYWARLIPILFLIIFRAIFPSIWFWITDRILRLCSGVDGRKAKLIFSLLKCSRLGENKEKLNIPLSSNPERSRRVQQLIIWILTTWLYQLWMDQCHLWIFDVCEGYMLLNPLVPLAVHPKLLYLLPLIGSLLLLYLIACSAQMAYVLISKSAIAFSYMVLMIIPWLGGFFIERDTECSEWTHAVIALQQRFITRNQHQHALATFHEECTFIMQHYPHIGCIICPETCMYENYMPAILQCYACDLMHGMPQIIGGFGFDQDHRNTAYCIQNQKLYMFDKRHAMPLTERMPQWAQISLLNDLYFTDRPQIIPSRNIRPLWHICGHVVTPYICSELFFNNHPDDAYPGVTILALCNDAWAPQSIKYLMYLGAQYRAQEWQRDIVYVSYMYVALIKKNGIICPLQTIS